MVSSRTRAQTCVPRVGRRILNHCATKEAPSGNLLNHLKGGLKEKSWAVAMMVKHLFNHLGYSLEEELLINCSGAEKCTRGLSFEATHTWMRSHTKLEIGVFLGNNLLWVTHCLDLSFQVKKASTLQSQVGWVSGCLWEAEQPRGTMSLNWWVWYTIFQKCLLYALMKN